MGYFQGADICVTGVPENEEVRAKTSPNLTQSQTYRAKNLNEHLKLKNMKKITPERHNQIAWN